MLWFESIHCSFRKQSPKHKLNSRRATPFRPCLESREDRLVLSTFTVIDLGDTGSSSGLQGDCRARSRVVSLAR